MICPVCKSEKIKVVTTGNEYASVKFRTRKCKNCDAIFQTTEEINMSMVEKGKKSLTKVNAVV